MTVEVVLDDSVVDEERLIDPLPLEDEQYDEVKVASDVPEENPVLLEDCDELGQVDTE